MKKTNKIGISKKERLHQRLVEAERNIKIKKYTRADLGF